MEGGEEWRVIEEGRGGSGGPGGLVRVSWWVCWVRETFECEDEDGQGGDCEAEKEEEEVECLGW